MNKLVLGIETSCDDTSMAIYDGSSRKILSHLKYGQEEVLKEWGGVVPEIAARNHLDKIPNLLDAVFKEAQLSPSDIDLIGVTSTPGLLGPLLTGLNCAKTLALIHKKPILPVNHLYAHLEAVHIDQSAPYPYLGLLISGGHSLFFWVEAKDKFNVLGSTIDDAAGEAFDKGAKLLGLGYPGGHIIDKLASFGNPKRYDFPIGLKSSADCRLSFSGLKTSLRVFLEKHPKHLKLKPNSYTKKEEGSQDFYDLCASYQDAIVRALELKLRYAIKKVKEKYEAENFPIVIGGGVACNSQIAKDLKKKYPAVLSVSKQFCTDNGAMIANFAFLNQESAIAYPKCLELDAKGRFINKKDFL